MPFNSDGHDLDFCAVLAQCLELAATTAHSANAPPRDATLRTMATAIVAGVDSGVRDRRQLITIALRSLPEMRDVRLN